MPRARALDLRQFQELTLHLALRDIVSMNRWTLLGWTWPLVRQLAQLAVLVFVFSTALDLNIENYPVFVFSGLVAWSWFSSGLSSATNSLIARRHLVFQPRVPVAVLPVVSVVVPMFDALMAMPVLLLMLALTDGLSWTVVLLPLVIALQLLIMAGLAWGLSGAAVYLRDVGNIVAVGLTMLFYMTPVFYDRDAVPERYQWILGLNPVTPLIEAYRDILLLGRIPPVSRLAALLAMGVVACVVGYALFRRLRGGFVDEL